MCIVRTYMIIFEVKYDKDAEFFSWLSDALLFTFENRRTNFHLEAVTRTTRTLGVVTLRCFRLTTANDCHRRCDAGYGCHGNRLADRHFPVTAHLALALQPPPL